MENYANGSEIPMGLGMALAKNVDAMNYFSSLFSAFSGSGGSPHPIFKKSNT